MPIDNPSPAIDPGEAWAAVLGVKPVLSKRVETITDGQKAEVAKLPETIAKRAKSLCSDGIVGKPIEMVNYEKLLQQSSEALDVVGVESMIKELPADDQLAYMTVAERSFVALQKALPVSTYTTFSGAHNLRPGLAALVKFSALFGGLEDVVGYVFCGIANGSIDREVVAILKTVFPTLTAEIDSSIMDAVAERVAKSKAYTLPPRAEIGMASWRGAKVEGPVVAPPSAPQKGRGSGGSKDADVETPGQEIEAG